MTTSQMRRSLCPWLLASLAGTSSLLCAQPINVANYSFELPTTSFVDPRVDSWTKSPQPEWFQPQGGITWDQLSGVFANTALGTPSHIENLNGSQAVYLFALPQAGFGQILADRYEAGLQYSMTVALRGGGNIVAGSNLLLGLFYVDDLGVQVPLATTIVSYSPSDFAQPSLLRDRQVTSAFLAEDHAALGRNIGLQILATSGGGEGYWDLDNVRVVAHAVPEPHEWSFVAAAVPVLLWSRRRAVGSVRES